MKWKETCAAAMHTSAISSADFSTMEYYVKDRTRKQLKAKYKVEQKKNPRLVDMAMYSKVSAPLGEFFLSILGRFSFELSLSRRSVLYRAWHDVLCL